MFLQLVAVHLYHIGHCFIVDADVVVGFVKRIWQLLESCVCVCMCVYIYIYIYIYIYVYIYIYIQGVTGMCETSGECSLGKTIPI